MGEGAPLILRLVHHSTRAEHSQTGDSRLEDQMLYNSVFTVQISQACLKQHAPPPSTQTGTPPLRPHRVDIKGQ